MQLPSNILDRAFSEIDVNKKGDRLEIFYSTMVGLSDDMAENWMTAIAIDASVSMSDAFGRGLTGTVPEDIKKRYKKKRWIQTRNHDGHTVHYWSKEAYEDAIKNGYLRPTSNIVEKEARKFSSYLAENLDQNGRTDIILWACGRDGKSIEEYGETDAGMCKTMEFRGPRKHCFGIETHLLPAVEYFERKYRSAERGLFIFITDGKLDDLEALKTFTVDLARKIESKQRNFFKAIIIGIGEEIDEDQMVELDDLDTGTDVDIWDHKIAKEMKDIMEIFAELVDSNRIVGPYGVIYDGDGNVVKKFSDGVPAKGFFELPPNNTFFTFEVAGKAIKQKIVKSE